MPDVYELGVIESILNTRSVLLLADGRCYTKQEAEGPFLSSVQIREVDSNHTFADETIASESHRPTWDLRMQPS